MLLAWRLWFLGDAPFPERVPTNLHSDRLDKDVQNHKSGAHPCQVESGSLTSIDLSHHLSQLFFKC